MDMVPLELTDRFECANATDIRRVDATSFTLSTRPDCALDNERYRMADYYVAFRLINRNARPITASIEYRELDFPDTGRTIGVRAIREGRPLRVDDWRPLPREHVDVHAEENVCALRLTAEVDSMLDVSSMYWMSATQVAERLEEIGRDHDGVCIISSLGETAEGRDIPVVDLSPLSPPDAPLGIIGATPQCHELGTIAVMGILEAALDGRLDDVVRRCRLSLLPLANPDGNALGTCMTNAQRQNIIFGFGEAGTGHAADECEALWPYITGTHGPSTLSIGSSISDIAFYLEFHSYPHLNRPSFRPYDFDRALFPDERSRARGEIFFRAVNEVSPNPPLTLVADTPGEHQFRPTLISRLIREYGLPATLYKLHNRETIADNRRHAIEVLEHVVPAMCP